VPNVKGKVERNQMVPEYFPFRKDSA